MNGVARVPPVNVHAANGTSHAALALEASCHLAPPRGATGHCLLAACAAVWIVGGVAQDRAIGWESVAVLWLIGRPVLSAGFSLTDSIEPRVCR